MLAKRANRVKSFVFMDGRHGGKNTPAGLGSIPSGLAFPFEEGPLPGRPAAEAAEAARGGENPVARDEKRKRIRPGRRADRAACARLSDGAGDVAVGAGFPVGDGGDFAPDRTLERRPGGGAWQGEPAARPGPVFAELPFGFQEEWRRLRAVGRNGIATEENRGDRAFRSEDPKGPGRGVEANPVEGGVYPCFALHAAQLPSHPSWPEAQAS